MKIEKKEKLNSYKELETELRTLIELREAITHNILKEDEDRKENRLLNLFLNGSISISIESESPEDDYFYWKLNVPSKKMDFYLNNKYRKISYVHYREKTNVTELITQDEKYVQDNFQQIYNNVLNCNKEMSLIINSIYDFKDRANDHIIESLRKGEIVKDLNKELVKDKLFIYYNSQEDVIQIIEKDEDKNKNDLILIKNVSWCR